MADSHLSRSALSYTARLDRALISLQSRVKEQEALLEELRANAAPIETEPSADPKAHIQQLRLLKHAYQSLTPSEPYLPPRESPLPALLALRVTDRTISETKEAIVTSQINLQSTKELLEKQQSDLADAKLIQRELEARIASLQQSIEEQTQKSPSQIAKDMMQETKKKGAHYESEMGKLVKAFNMFIDEHLAPMLAVEALGGPIVGEVLEVDDEMLEGTFSAQGKAKKGKLKEDKRQRRIDDIWGQHPTDEDWDEKRAAAADMRELTEELLNSLVDAGGNGPGAYVELKKETAAARFLVRSKVAQFHPRDARKLRLVDFGGEIDD